MTRSIAAFRLAMMAGVAFALAPAAAQIPAGDWRSYGRDGAGMRYSPLDQIGAANVSRLAKAWTFDMRPADSTSTRQRVSVMTPLAVDGVLYLATPYGKLVAIDGDSGREIWSHSLPNEDQVGGRGLEYWPGGGKLSPRIFFGTRDGLLAAVDAHTGQPSQGFPINLRTAEVMNGLPKAPYAINTAPVIYKDIVITGARLQESPALGPRGDVRGWDARTGKLLWTFHSIPQPGEMGHDTWEGDSWKQRAGVNIWNQLTVDADRGIAYLPFSAPTYDRIGIDRKGANLFSSSLVAVDARTGKYLWHFQLVHHDIWDLDVPVQPTLVDVTRGGKKIPAVAITSKMGLLFILDRVTGKPLFDVKETPVPASSLPGEQAWPTQPVPVAPPPIGRQEMTMADISTLTPEHEALCRKRIADEKISFAVPFEPLRSDHPTVRFPGSGGGPNWGGGAFNPQLGLYFINTSNVGSVEQMVQDKDGRWYNPGGSNSWFADNQKEWMCQQGPWGELSAVDVSSGKIVWQSTLGVTDTAPEGKQATGRPNVGGPIVTAGGLLFVGATDDARFRAFDARNGKELWTTKLDASAHSTPITYMGKSGRQYVAIVSGGGSYLGSPAKVSHLVTFALPGQ